MFSWLSTKTKKRLYKDVEVKFAKNILNLYFSKGKNPECNFWMSG
jgi:hypothetical protein